MIKVGGAVAGAVILATVVGCIISRLRAAKSAAGSPTDVYRKPDDAYARSDPSRDSFRRYNGRYDNNGRHNNGYYGNSGPRPPRVFRKPVSRVRAIPPHACFYGNNGCYNNGYYSNGCGAHNPHRPNYNIV